MLRIALITITFCSTHIFAQCAKCQQIREYNAAHPENNYTYYEDYLKDQEKQKEAPDTSKDLESQK